MNYIIGVDGGGTKTVATAYNMNDEKIAGSLAGPGNPAVDFELAETSIKMAVSQCLHSVKVQGIAGECQGIYMGIAGIEVGANRTLLETRIGREFHCRAVGVHDSELVHAAVFEGRDGIITISGTGSVSYGRFKGMVDKTGGWGHVLGDEGSGYWIALEALKQMTMSHDLGLGVSTLSQQIITHLGVTTIAGMKDFIHTSGKYEIAAIATIVVQLAQRGNPYALDILDRAGRELAIMTERLYSKLAISEPVEIGYSGGILLHVMQVRESFQAHLESKLDSIMVLDKSVCPTKGACHLHRMSTT